MRLESGALTVAEADLYAKRWRRSRDRGLPVLWLATAQNLTLTAEGRAADQARACGTWALLAGSLAAAGRTARLSGGHEPGGEAC
jgi:hypothetical protein